MVNTETWIALFLLFTAIAYLISYILFLYRTVQAEPQFTYVAIFSLIAGIFFVIYAGLNYYHVSYGKGQAHIDYLDKNTNQGRYAPSSDDTNSSVVMNLPPNTPCSPVQNTTTTLQRTTLNFPLNT